jgi:hypothetical protein
MGEKEDAYIIIRGIPEGRRPLGRPRRRWEVNVKRNRMGGYGFICLRTSGGQGGDALD